MKRAFRIEFRRGFYSIGFYLGILLIMIAALMNTGEVLRYIEDYGFPEGEIRCLAVIFQAMLSETLCYLIPIASTLAMSASYLEDLQSGTLNYIVLRTTKKRYLWSKVENCALFGGLTVFLAVFILFVGLLIAFPINAVEVEYFKMHGADYYIPLILRVVVLVLNGMLYSLLGGVMAVITNNKYMAYAAPFIFYYVISTLFEAYLTNFLIINPKEWILMMASSMWIVFVILIVANAIAVIGYSRIIERRWIYD